MALFLPMRQSWRNKLWNLFFVVSHFKDLGHGSESLILDF